MKKIIILLFAMTFLAINTPAFSQNNRWGCGTGKNFVNGVPVNWNTNIYNAPLPCRNGFTSYSACQSPMGMQYSFGQTFPVMFQNAPQIMTVQTSGYWLVTPIKQLQSYNTTCVDAYGNNYSCVQQREVIVSYDYKWVQR